MTAQLLAQARAGARRPRSGGARPATGARCAEHSGRPRADVVGTARVRYDIAPWSDAWGDHRRLLGHRRRPGTPRRGRPPRPARGHGRRRPRRPARRRRRCGSCGAATAATLADPCDLVAGGRHRRCPTCTPCRPTCRSATTTSSPRRRRPGDPAGRHAPPLPRCPTRAWGWAAQLYAAALGGAAGASATSPTCAASASGRAAWAPACSWSTRCTPPRPVPPQQPSPYSPSSRLLAQPALPARRGRARAPTLGADLAPLADAGRALNDDRRIDRDAVLRAQAGGARRGSSPRFGPAAARRFERVAAPSRATPLDAFADCTARWPSGTAPAGARGPPSYRHPTSPAVAALRRRRARAASRFHAWCQWLLDGQLGAAAARRRGWSHDLAVGFDPGGADAWCWQDLLARGCRGRRAARRVQRRRPGLGPAAVRPWKLRAAGYEPFIETRPGRAAPRRRAAHRPRDGPVPPVLDPARRRRRPTAPTCATRATSCSTSLALESQRAGRVRRRRGPRHRRGRGARRARRAAACSRTGCCGSRTGPPSTFPEQALAAVTTHDLPTIAGVWTGRRPRGPERRRLRPGERRQRRRAFESRSTQATGLDDRRRRRARSSSATHEALAEAPSLIVVATLDDALAMVERPNMPGTVDEWPNWSLAAAAARSRRSSPIPLVLAVARGASTRGGRHARP